jgi:rubrerythrin
MRHPCGGSDAFGAVGAFDSTVAVASRRDVLRRAAVAGAMVVGGGALARSGAAGALASPSRAQDRSILNFALLLEYVQAAFYSQAVDGNRLRGELREFAETVAGHEHAHVRFLRKALGSGARREPTYHFGTATRDERKFVEAAVELENLGVAAYNGQVANLTKKTLAAAAEIVSVEGRHAAWISDLGGRDPAPRAADPGAGAAEVLAALRATGFVKVR